MYSFNTEKERSLTTSSTDFGDEKEPAKLPDNFTNLIFSKYEKVFQTVQGPAEVVSFPKGDIQVVTEKRRFRTVDLTVPEELRDPAKITTPYIRDCIEFFSQDYKVVKRLHSQYGTNFSVQAIEPDLLPNQLYEVDFDEEQNIKADDFNMELLKPDPEQLKHVMADAKAKDRFNLFQLFPISDTTTTLDPRKPGSAWEESLGFQFTVEVKELSFALGDLEPFFGCIALYDIKKKLKISENFYFDINSATTLELLGPHKGKREPATITNKALFSLSYISSDIYLVVSINKVLKGDEDAATDPYFNYNKLKPKEKTKFEEEIRDSCLRLGAYRQVFAWAAVKLFEEKTSGPLKLRDELLEINSLSKVKGDVFTFVLEMEKEKAKQKLKAFPGRLLINVQKSESDFPGRLDPALHPVVPTGSEIVREIRELKQEELNLAPHICYINELYLYPESINFNNYSGSVSARNIAIEVKLMDNDGNVQANELPVIYGKSTSSSLTTKETTCIFYHNKKPKFYDEIKIQLPPLLTPAHHILLSFFHIQCQDKKGKDDHLAAVLGYAVIPILEDGRYGYSMHSSQLRIITDDTRGFPVCTVFPPGYRDPKHQEALANKWVDSKKPIFTCRTKLVSTIYSQDDNLDHFLHNYNIAEVEEHILQAIQGLQRAKLHSLVQFFPTVMKQLTRIIYSCSPPLAEEAFVTMVNTVDKIHQAAPPNSILEPYITYVYQNGENTLFYERFLQTWVSLLQKGAKISADSYKYSWFLFGIITKSMILKLHSENQLDSKASKQNLFSEQFIMELRNLTNIIVKEVTERSHKGLIGAKNLNINMALFFKDMLSTMDRGCVFEMIYNYGRSIDLNNTVPVLVEFKFHFLKIISDHEHYIPLNMPDSRDKIDSPAEIKETFWQSHFLAGLLLNEIDNAITQDQEEIRLKAVEALRYQLRKHDFDPRYQDVEKRKMVAGIYFPFILTMIDNASTIKRARRYERRNWLICFLFLLKGIRKRLLRDWWKKETLQRKQRMFEMISSILHTFEYEGKNKIAEEPMEETPEVSEYVETSTDLQTEALYLDKPKKRDIPKKKITTAKKGSLSGTTSSARPSIDPKEVLETMYMPNRPVTASNEQRTRKNTDLRPWATGAANTSAVISKDQTKNSTRDPKREQNLFQEIALSACLLLSLMSVVVLDVLVDFIKDFNEEMMNRKSVFIVPAFEGFTLLLRKNQSMSFLSCLFAVLAVEVTDFKRPLFRFRNSICGELSFEILRHCNMRNNVTRAEACSLLYLLLSGNYKEMRNFSRMKLQCTIAISKLVGGSSSTDFDNLKKSLQVVAKRSKERHPKEGSLGTQVEEMVTRLFGVIRDSLKLRETSWDPERTVELYYQISQGFLDSPDLRVTWLENLAEYHKMNTCYEEHAQTKILTAGLVFGYLKLLKRFPQQFDFNFEPVFPNAANNLTLPSASSLTPLEGDICQSKIFSEDGYVDLLIQAVTNLRLNESCIELYQLLLPVHQRSRNYNKQAECYKDLYKMCRIVVDENQNKQKLYSNYYRVAFYGPKLEELDDTEWVYKESSAVRLADVSDKLKTQYEGRYGPDKVHILPNTKPVNKSELDPDRVYMQIISVDIYLTPEELKQRETLFQQNFNINSFIFETPFTKSGKAHSADMAEQYKRKTTLIVENAFPYVSKRSKVINKSETILTPIETAIELIERKTVSLKAELSTATPNIKSLQMGLQGSLLMQVNAGPLEVCRVFLGDNMTKYNKEHVDKLVAIMNEFIRTLAKGLTVHQRLIKTDQLILQKELEAGLRSFQTEAQRYMSLEEEEEELIEEPIVDEVDVE